jgi:hypothetical protein
MKAWRCLRKHCYVFLAHVVEKKDEEIRLQDIPIVRDYPEVFHEDLSGLPIPDKLNFELT